MNLKSIFWREIQIFQICTIFGMSIEMRLFGVLFKRFYQFSLLMYLKGERGTRVLKKVCSRA